MCLPLSGNAKRLGITGIPGVGKSTFIDTLGNYLVQKNNRIAVLAVDPSSSQSMGSIMGDKIRMPRLAQHNNAFVRPSPAGQSLGGVTTSTREAIILCEAAGFDIIIIETVGVGQSEVAVHNMVDFFLLLKLAGAGDELQGMKRGIIELADMVVINKADGKNKHAALEAQQIFNRALQLFKPREGMWQTRALSCSAIEETGIESVWKEISRFFEIREKKGLIKRNRNRQNKKWLLEAIEQELKTRFYSNKQVKKTINGYLAEIEKRKITPYAALKKVFDESEGATPVF